MTTWIIPLFPHTSRHTDCRFEFCCYYSLSDTLLPSFVFDNIIQRYKKYARKKSWCIRNKHNYKFHKFESYSGKIDAKIVKNVYIFFGKYLASNLKLMQVHGNSNRCDVNPHIKSPLGDELHRHSLLWRLKMKSHSPLNEHQTLSTRIHKV
jgi:hypothetical protein